MRQTALAMALGAAVAAFVYGWGTFSEAVTAQTPGRPTAAAAAANLRNGPQGLVKVAKTGQPVEGLMVQLIFQKNSIRTTVYTNNAGRYEFPRLESGTYILRIARPLEFRRYVKEGVQIDGATRLDDIVLERIAEGEFIPASPDVMTQLSGAEWIANMPGTGEEKWTIADTCGDACHSPDYIFRNVFTESGWRNLVRRMTAYNFRIMVPPPRGPESSNPTNELIVKWLTRYRSPDTAAPFPPIKPFPRPSGPATRVIVTEYESPWALGNNIHDVAGDGEGNIWFTPNKNPFLGKLDPATGKVTLYRIPKPPPMKIVSQRAYKHSDPPGIHPGTHWLDVDKKTGVVWFSDTWSESLGRFDPRTGDFQLVNTGLHGNVTLSPDGSIWRTDEKRIKKYDTATVMKTGTPVKEYPLQRLNNTYGNFVSAEGRYFGGGGSGIVWLDTQTDELREVAIQARGRGRGGFDRDGNIWIGTSKIVKYDPKANLVSEYASPTPYVTFYSVKPDKNGDVWAGEMQGGRIARFNPRTHQWIHYVLPTPWSFDYSSWIDNSTDPPTYWYGDNYGHIVRIQPLE